MRRLGIFSFNDYQGVVDDYITFLLDDIVDNLDELCIVASCELTQDSFEKLNKYQNSEVIFRSNLGFDAGAWRDVIVDHYGFEKLLEFDEVVLFNNSFFGPLYPFKTMFDEMDSRDIDFWGITSQGETPNPKKICPYENCPSFIQTYFLVFRKNLIQSSDFQKYWNNLPYYKDAEKLLFKHEVVFTKYFEDLGFKWDVFINTKDREGNMDINMNFYSLDTYNLVMNRNLPVIDRNMFTYPRIRHLTHSNASISSNVIDYVKEFTNYDVSLIYKSLLRTMEPSNLVDNLNLTRIFNKNYKVDFKTDKKVLLIVHLYYEDIWEYAFNYIKNTPSYIDILITTDTDDKKSFFKENIIDKLDNNCKIMSINARGRDMASLLVASRDIVKNYDYFCFMHDKKSSASSYSSVGEIFRDIIWENNLASESYINSIVKEFDENSALGLIVPPRVYHGPYFYGYINNFWVENFDMTSNLLDQMGIKTSIKKGYPPLAIGNCFWAKYDALEPVFELFLEHEDFSEEPMPVDGTISHALERVYGYVAASRGYYTEFVMTEEFARCELFNYQFMLMDTLSTINKKNSGEVRCDYNYLLFHNTLGNIFKKRKKKNKKSNSKNKFKRILKKFKIIN